MSNSFHIVRNIGVASDAAAGPSVEKLIQKLESMSTTADARPLRGGPLVSKLMEKYELLSCSAVSRPLRRKSTTRGGEGEKGGPVASPLKPQNLHCMDERNAVPAHVYSGTRPHLKPSWSGDGDRRLLHLRNCLAKNFFLARYYNRCRIELVSLEKCSEYRHSSCGFRDALTAPGTTTTTSEVPYTSTMIVVTDAAVSSSYTGSDNLYKTAPSGRR